MRHMLLALAVGLAPSATANWGGHSSQPSGRHHRQASVFSQVHHYRWTSGATGLWPCHRLAPDRRQRLTTSIRATACRETGSTSRSTSGVAVTTGGANAGKPNLSIFAESATFASLSASFAGRLVVSDSIIHLQSHGLLSGTFKSSVTVGAPFTGSWKCNGPLSAY